jgi:hypothetical protein
MPDISIRKFSDEEYAAIKEKASAAGESMEGWAKALILQAIEAPLVRERYAYRFFGPGDARGTVRRLSDDVNGVGGGFHGMTTLQVHAVRKAEDLMRRNDPGDQLKAYDLLKAQFEEVFEVPV